MLASLNKDVVGCLRRSLRARQMKFGAPAYITGTVHTRDNLVQYIGYAQANTGIRRRRVAASTTSLRQRQTPSPFRRSSTDTRQGPRPVMQVLRMCAPAHRRGGADCLAFGAYRARLPAPRLFAGQPFQ